ncbi:hypothetical protein OPT61_g6926 [Boeremia exigua]|uniref:Uncharacterized protein n=1 Tax=Boeremia exigua TaxID=749465 RepID=A0ACC2I489_9PLEO|nr:hypothetical protein OPT61_g6926 [Boeremia exigua]
MGQTSVRVAQRQGLIVRYGGLGRAERFARLLRQRRLARNCVRNQHGARGGASTAGQNGLSLRNCAVLITQRVLLFVYSRKYQSRGGTEPTARRQRPVAISTDCTSRPKRSFSSRDILARGLVLMLISRAPHGQSAVKEGHSGGQTEH